MPRGDVRIPVAPAIRGFRSDLPKHLVPDEFLTDGQNIVVRNGVILVRTGMVKLTSTAPASTSIMGGIYYKDNVGVEHVLAASTTDFYHFDGSTWTTVTGSALTGTTSNQVRFSVFPLSTTTRVIAVNDKDVPQSYTGSGNFAALGGSPPIAKDVCASFQRIILANVTIGGNRRGSSLWVSGFQDPTSWPATNQVDLPDTGDTIVGVRALNNQVFVVYKEFSQWLGIGAGNLFPFVFQLQSQQPGPVSPNAIVQVEALHYYLGIDGNIYLFDGSRCSPVGSRVRQLIQADIDPVNSGKAHGFYDPTNREIWWFWPSLSNIGGFAGIVYRLPYDEMPDAFSPLQVYGVNTTSSFLWRNTSGLTWVPGLNPYAGWTSTDFIVAFPNWLSLSRAAQWASLVGGSTGDIFLFNQAGGDNGQTITANWETPLRSLAGVGENVRLDVIESAFKLMPIAINAEIVAVTSDTLADTGTSQTPQTIDLSIDTKHRAIYYDLFSRFVGIRHRIASAISGIEYRGSVVFAYKREEQ